MMQNPMMRIMQKLRGQPTCEEVLEALQSYLDGEIDEEQAMKIAKHLKNCQNCDSESKTYGKIKQTLAKRREPVDPEVLSALNQFGLDLAKKSDTL